MNFTGRKEILLSLQQGDKGREMLSETTLPKAIYGLGGVGKTAVAIEYAHRYRHQYEVIWWISSERRSQVISSLAALAGALGLDTEQAGGIEDAATAALQTLRTGTPDHRWLLIFDNAGHPEDLTDLIPHGPGDVLITSRNNQWQAFADAIPIDVFTREESTNFLTRRVPGGLSRVDAGRLSEMLGDLPLAFNQAGAVLRRLKGQRLSLSGSASTSAAVI